MALSSRSLVAFGLPALFGLATVARCSKAAIDAYSMPADAKSFGAAVLEAMKAIASWSLWWTAPLALAVWVSYTLYIFGADRIWRALATLSDKEMRAARIAQTLSDDNLTAARGSLFARAILARVDWSLAASAKVPSQHPVGRGMSASENQMILARANREFDEIVRDAERRACSEIEELNKIAFDMPSFTAELIKMANDDQSAFHSLNNYDSMYFMSEDHRSRWARAASRINAVNIAKMDLRRNLENMASEAYRVSIPSYLVPQLLRDTVLEKQP